MTNTLHENGHWINQDNKLDNNLVITESSSIMERSNHLNSSSASSNLNQQEQNNSTNNNHHNDDGDDDDQIEDDEEDLFIESANDNDDDENKSTPYLYTGHLGTTSPQVLKHIDEAIDSVVKHYHSSKSDLISPPSSPIFNTSSTSNQQNNKSSNVKRSQPKKKKKKKTTNYNPFGDDHLFDLSASTKKQQKKSDQKKKDNLIGPFIRVEKKKNQTNYIVVNSNSSKLEDKDSKLFNKPNYGSIVGTIARAKSSNQILFKHNDQTWICVFCKRQPHYKQLGDLFGPHELISDKELDAVNSNGLIINNNSNTLTTATNSPSTSHHHHHHHTNNNSTTPNNNSGTTTQIKTEVWFHEDCIIWSNGLYLAGNRVRNIDEVVLECCDITCCACKLKGANLGCVQKGCNQTFHFICAKESGCELDEESFSMFCINHKKSNEQGVNQ